MSAMHHINNFKYAPLPHRLTRLDPRLKLIAALALLVMVISSKSLTFPLLTALLCAMLSLSVGVRPRLLLIRFAEPVFIALLVVLLKLFFAGKLPLFTLSIFGWEVTGHSDGLLEGLLIASRIAGGVTVVALVGFTTPFTEIMAALAWLRVPTGFIEVTMFAWRYLFLLFDDAQVVYAAQKNRLGYDGYRRGLRSFGTLAGALVIKAFDNSQAITTAMVQRGYDGQLPLLQQRQLRCGEVLAALSIVLVIGLFWQVI